MDIVCPVGANCVRPQRKTNPHVTDVQCTPLQGDGGSRYGDARNDKLFIIYTLFIYLLPEIIVIFRKNVTINVYSGNGLYKIS